MAISTRQAHDGGGAGEFTPVGAATIHAALRATSDAVYVAVPEFQPAGFSLWDFQPHDDIPAGSRVFAVRTRLRGVRGTGGVVLDTYPVNAGGVGHVDSFPLSTSITTHLGPWRSSRPGGGAWTLADVQGPGPGASFGFEAAVRITVNGAGRRVHRLWVDVDYRTPPVATITSPAGTITNTTRPRIEWTYTQADGMAQSAYRVTFYEGPGAGALVHDSGVLSGSATSYVPPDLPNGAYHVRLIVWANWPLSGELRNVADETAEFTLNTTPPVTPTVTLTLIDEPNTAGRRLGHRVNVSGSGTPAPWASVEYRDPDDFDPQWRPLRHGTMLFGSFMLWNVTDWEAPLADREYRARAFVEDAVSGNLIASDWSDAESAALPGSTHMLRDVLAGTAGDHMALSVAHGSEGRGRQGQLAQALGVGAALPTLGVGKFGAPVWTHTVQLFTEAEADRFDRLISQQRILLLCWPSGKRAWVGIESADDEVVLAASDRWLRRVQVTYVEGVEPTEGLP